MSLTVSTRGDGLAELMRQKPAELEQELDRAGRRGALEIARRARRDAPKAESNLTNSITVRRIAPGYHRIVVGAAYGRAVEEGSDPGGFPPQRSIEDWISVRGIEPNDPEMNREDLAFLIAQSIFEKGIEAQPFFEPAFNAKSTRAQQLLDDAVEKVWRL